jgi:dihydroxyacetone kinase-like protein
MISALNSAVLLDWLQRAAKSFADQREHLSRLDANIGDGDHGENLARGFNAILAKLPTWAGDDPAALFKNVAMTLISTVGGASGPLYGSFFLDASKAAAGRAELTLENWGQVFEAGVHGVQSRGKASLGDKTMLDALIPAAEVLQHATVDCQLVAVLRRCADAAGRGAESTAAMFARKGRASYLGERSAGHPDPGATSSYLLLSALADAAEASADV